MKDALMTTAAELALSLCEWNSVPEDTWSVSVVFLCIGEVECIQKDHLFF